MSYMTGKKLDEHKEKGEVMKKVYRYDINAIDFMHIDDNGFLRGDGVVTRIGVFTYVNPDGTLRKELRHPEDTLKIDSIRTMKMIPITDGHPTEMVNPQNVKRLAVGHVGENIRPNGAHIIAPVVITDEEAITKVNNGKKALSLGYLVDLINEVGEYDGSRYDYRQTNIKYNHLAIVDSARAGNNAELKFDGMHLDSGDAILLDYDEDKTTNKVDKNKKNDSNNNNRKEVQMVGFRIDNIEYQCAPEIVNFIDKQQKKNDVLDKELHMKLDEIDKMTKVRDTLTAERDDAKGKLVKLEEKNKDTREVDKLVKERIDVLQIANATIKNGVVKVDGKDVKIVDVSNINLKKAIVLSQFADANFEGKSVEYVNARYDAIVESVNKDGIQSQIVSVNKQGTNEPRVDADVERDNMMKEMKKAHLPASK